MHLLVHVPRRQLLLLRVPRAGELGHLAVVMLERAVLVHRVAELPELRLGIQQLPGDVSVGQPDAYHLLQELARPRYGLLNPLRLAARRVLQPRTARAALEVEEVLARGLQVVVLHLQQLGVARHVLIELNVLQEVLQIEALWGIVRVRLDPHLPVGAIEALHLERYRDVVGRVGVGDDGAKGVGQYAEAAPLEVHLLHGEGVGGQGGLEQGCRRPQWRRHAEVGKTASEREEVHG